MGGNLDMVTRSTGLMMTCATTHIGETEHDGLHEFNVVKIERGNGPGELQVTVDNSHDFVHKDIAFYNCVIKPVCLVNSCRSFSCRFRNYEDDCLTFTVKIAELFPSGIYLYFNTKLSHRGCAR